MENDESWNIEYEELREREEAREEYEAWLMRYRQNGKAQDFDSCTVGSSPTTSA